MATRGRTLTAHFHIESKQHEVFNIDLGEGIPRRMLVFGLIVTAAWVLVMIPILGVPNQLTFSVYFMPPVLFAYFAYQDSTRQPRRKNLTQWAIWARYVVAGHRPVVALGSRAAYRSEYLPLRRRVPVEEIKKFLAPTNRPEWETGRDEAEPWEDGQLRAGSPVSLSQTAELIGFDYMQALRAGSTPRGRTKEKR